MRIGLLGGVAEHLEQLEGLVQFLLRTLRADRIYYLGGDEALSDFVAHSSQQLLSTSEQSVWHRSLRCLHAVPDEIDRFLNEEQQLTELTRLVSLPKDTTLRVQLSAEHEAILCFDRDDLSAAQAASCSVVAFGKDSVPLVRQQGEKFMLCPGSLEKAGVMLLADDEHGLCVALFDRNAQQIAQHYLSEASSQGESQGESQSSIQPQLDAERADALSREDHKPPRSPSSEPIEQ